MVPVHQKLFTGDILITDSPIPFIQHFGVVVVEDSTTCVYHCTPESGVTMDTISSFFATRKLVDVRRTGAKAADIYRRYRELKARRYDAIKFNCIHFAECLTGR